tara:strand:+ start:15183 stop:15560 length:378 start_codon:yes stop_codon:yes gene_type:complete
MSLTVKGVVHQITPTEKGNSKAGKEFVKRSIVIDTAAQYNPYISFGAFGDDKCDMLDNFKQGDQVEVSFNLSSREYQSKWYTQADFWKIDKIGSSNKSMEGVVDLLEDALKPADLSNEDNDDLPF